MRKMILLLILFSLIFTYSLYAIDRKTAEDTIQWKVLVTVDNCITPYVHRGIVIDVQTIKGVDYLLLQTFYYETPRLFVKLSNIVKILKLKKLTEKEITGIYQGINFYNWFKK